MGDWVLRGENIASVGNTGGLDKHALYFEIRQNGKPANPKNWLLGKN
jgi:septal ring factor EnvC (AmiA/AmiB activator)